ncbi:MAG: hypothetical protein P8N43_05595 [Alphaproteobacteria bacterium]|nr:hypothetical protein [Alphaproteobacteria bacterium]
MIFFGRQSLENAVGEYVKYYHADRNHQGRGVDGLITDKPALARSVLEWRSQMSVAERLIMELAGIFGVTPQFGEQ